MLPTVVVAPFFPIFMFDHASYVSHVCASALFRVTKEVRTGRPSACPNGGAKAPGRGTRRQCANHWVPRQRQTIRKGGTQSHGSLRDRQAAERYSPPGNPSGALAPAVGPWPEPFLPHLRVRGPVRFADLTRPIRGLGRRGKPFVRTIERSVPCSPPSATASLPS